ncbi:exodeoxyribonuclease V subunit alpha [Colwellia hornerae]|uniref:RecBCD enzyme subunit RecD n=1 Tax=Colwellia hornerae TaxID=89402 RepID=A0A5C6Q922_9GAMM|nr:exodeoxyribonuclease V subunit alpha [Colwellia hornerae]TWX57771.1 exodeoxyribonuclease V subunit alpha [Colwellia hornerae]TWX62498.1 exodeoxyribonuclease V subunit alpha [Colwellia hornerae]TWX65057.1 exodeoxyribonuclease V subunit alpha [Colwellia hornerae]
MPALYKQFNHAQQQLNNIEAVDYFFAKEIQQSLDKHNNSDQQFFHLLIALSESLRAGHSCLPLATIASTRFGYSCDKQGIVTHNGFTFAEQPQLVSLCEQLFIKPDDNHAIVFYENNVYLRRYYHFEQELLTFISAKSAQAKDANVQIFEALDIKNCLAALFPAQLSADDKDEIDWQKVAVANAINKKFSIIAGGPGTGKTYTVTKLLAALVMLNSSSSSNKKLNGDLKIALVAPTGKAAQRLSESVTNALLGFTGQISAAVLSKIPQEAQTLHRLLGVIPNSVNFRHHQDNLLNIDVLLIDEVSMVDLALMVRVFRALPSRCQIILLGDADQLPSVAAGSVLNDLAPKPHRGYSPENQQYLSQVSECSNLPQWQKPSKSSALTLAADHVVFLDKSRRFDGEGGIGKIASHVINGHFSESWQLLTEKPVIDNNHQNVTKSDNTLCLLEGKASSWLPAFVSEYYAPIFAQKTVSAAFKQLQKFRILCATRVGEQGVESLNEHVQNILIKRGDINAFETRYCGQPIMINVNNYSLGLYNGDIGLLWKNEAGHLMAVFEQANNEYKWVNPARLPQHETVYAMTIHKTQGSEFEHVVMVLPEQTDNKLLSRELMYTAITRAKQKLSIATLANVWRQGVMTKTTRYSGVDLYKK